MQTQLQLGRLLGGLAVGAGLMFWLDPRSGSRRRALVVDKAIHAQHRGSEGARVLARDVAHRTRGLAARLRSLALSDEADDDVVVARVRSRLGQVCSHPSAIEVSDANGAVTLRGPILRRELERVVRAVKRVRGVGSVTSELEPYDEPGNVPGLQGGALRRGSRFELLQEHWSPTARLLSVVGGSGLLGLGLRRGGVVGSVLGGVGALFAARGATNLELRRLSGLPSRAP
jgi:hypothetical protein